MTMVLSCDSCGKFMAMLRDARVRTGMVVYCVTCNQSLRRPTPDGRVPEFIKALFKGKL